MIYIGQYSEKGLLMQLKELFADDITRDIPPVVYFHEQDPEKVRQEVSEYIRPLA